MTVKICRYFLLNIGKIITGSTRSYLQGCKIFRSALFSHTRPSTFHIFLTSFTKNFLQISKERTLFFLFPWIFDFGPLIIVPPSKFFGAFPHFHALGRVRYRAFSPHIAHLVHFLHLAISLVSDRICQIFPCLL